MEASACFRKSKIYETAEEQRQNFSASVDIPKLIKHHLKLISQSVEIPNEIQGSLEDDGNQTAFLPNLDHNEVPNIMQESLEDEGRQNAFVPNPANWFEVEKILQTKKKKKRQTISH